MPTPRVTVVVPTRERPEALARCLEALRLQTLGAALEIVVVQDGDDLQGLEARLGSIAPARVVRQPQAGPGAARNRGAAVARAPVLCFTDDDCEPDTDWAENMERAVAGGASGAVGRTVNATPGHLSGASQLVVNHLVERSREGLLRTTYGVANNIAVRADVFRDVPFDPRFRFAGGDRDWSARMRAAGHELAYVPSAVVRHKHRLTTASFCRQHFAYGRGAYRFRTRHDSPRRLEPVGFYTSLLGRARDDGVGVTALVALSQAATAAGYVVEATRTLRRASPVPPERPPRSSRASA